MSGAGTASDLQFLFDQQNTENQRDKTEHQGKGQANAVCQPSCYQKQMHRRLTVECGLFFHVSTSYMGRWNTRMVARRERRCRMSTRS